MQSAPTIALQAPAPTAPALRSWATSMRLLRRFAPVRARATAIFLLQLVRVGLELASPMLLGATIGSLDGFRSSQGELPESFVRLVTIYAVTVVLRSLAQYVTALASASLAQDVENGLRAELFAKVMRLRFRWHDANRSGKTIARSLRDMEKAKGFYREVVFGYVEMAIVAVGVLALSFALHWSYGVVAFVLLWGPLLVTAWAARRIAVMDKGISDEYDRVTTALQENVAGARVVRAFGREEEEVEKYGGRLGVFTASWKVLVRFWTTLMPILHHTSYLVSPAAILVGAWRYAAEPTPARLGEVMAVMLYLRTARDRLRPLTRLVLVGQEAVASAVRVFEVLDNPDVLSVTPTIGARHAAAQGALAFEGVSFTYPAGRKVLDGVDLVVPAGTSLGLLGRTGAGKTTLVHLVPRFYDPDEGCVRLHGRDVRELDPAELAASVGLVFQEPFLFSASVADNVAYGRPGASRDEVAAACRLAAADEFVRALPRGYDTIIGERGVSLSGGQRQRLTIARALVMNPHVLIFDDATASVDALTEKELFDGIRAAAAGRTTLVISQRVTSIRWCDRVAVLDEGRIAAIGTHDELLERSPAYREVFEHQRLDRGSP